MNELCKALTDIVDRVEVCVCGFKVHLSSTPAHDRVWVNLPLYFAGEHFRTSKYAVCQITVSADSVSVSGVEGDVDLSDPAFVERLESILVERVKDAVPTRADLMSRLMRGIK